MSVTNDVLANEIKNLSLQMQELKLTLDRQSGTFVTHEIFDLKIKGIDLEIAKINGSMSKLGGSRWLQNTLAAMFGAALSFLLTFFLTHLGS